MLPKRATLISLSLKAMRARGAIRAYRREITGRTIRLTAVLWALVSSATFAQTLPRWATIRPGALAYLASQGNGRDTPGQRSVCRDLRAWQAAHIEDDDDRCPLRHAFGLVRIRAVVGYDVERNSGIVTRIPLVAITSSSAHWSGVVIGLALIPLVPKGVRLTLQRGADFSRSRLIQSDGPDKITDGFLVMQPMTVELLEQRPPDDMHYEFRVRILTGSHRGELGWTLIFSVPYGAYWMQERGNIIP